MINLFQTKDSQTKLTPKKLNQEVSRLKTHLGLTKDPLWDNKVFIDLSNIEWVNTSALVELILIIENLIENDIKVTVALPNRNMLSKESQHLRDNPNDKPNIERAIEGRKTARLWLHRLQIIKTLLFEHQPNEIKSNIKVLDVFDKELFENNPIEEESDYYKIHGPTDSKQKDVGEKYHVPLLWTKGDDYHSDYVKNILESCLDKNHAQIISDIVINELTKNVKVHSTKKHGLFCAVVRNRFEGRIYKTDYYESEMPFFRGCTKGERIVEIVFGDSGKGIIEVLKKHGYNRTGTELIKFAFDKWSTSIPYEDDMDSYIKRGTRGLYHIKRIMMNYEGMATIRTDEYCAGYYDLNIKEIEESDLQKFNGTLLTIRLLPDRARTLSGKYYPSSAIQEQSIKNFECLNISLENINDGLSQIVKKIKTNSSENFLIFLEFPGLKTNETPDIYYETLRELLAKLSNLRHPNVHIVHGFPIYLPAPLLDEIVDGVNEAIKRKHEENKYLVFDPIMLIGPNSSIHWAGVQSQKLKEFLNNLMKSKELAIQINSFDNDDDKELIEYMKSDIALFNVREDGYVGLSFNKNAPVDYFIEKANEEIKKIESGQENNIFVTPNLNYVKGWFNFNDICKGSKNEYAILLYSLWNDHRHKILSKYFPDSFPDINQQETISNDTLDKIQESTLKDNLKILVESEVEIGKTFLQLLNIETHNNLKVLSDEVDSKRPRRNPLFEKSDYVIIISSVVSTKETANNLVKSVLRSGATPICFLSLADFSIKNENLSERFIEVWGTRVMHFSIISDHRLKATEPKDKLVFISPLDYTKESIPLNTSFYIEPELRNGILQSKSLHFSHIGKSNGRHFTFYFNAKRFINLENRLKIWSKFEPVISNWYNKLVETEFQNLLKNQEDTKANRETCLIKARTMVNSRISIWSPSPEPKQGFPGHELSVIIRDGIDEAFKFKPSVERTPRDESVKEGQNFSNINDNKIIVDWGAITGESIEKLIYKAHIKGFTNILVCIFLNQLSDTKKSYISKITSLTTEILVHEPPKDLFSQDKVISTKSHSSNVKVEFIYDFPLTCYESSYECNVCELREDLVKYEIPSSTLEKYARHRRKVLDIRSREMTDTEPFDFYSLNAGENILLDQELILRMFEFKTLLMNAQTSTYWRLRAKQELIGVLKSLITPVETNRIKKESAMEKEVWDIIIKESTSLVDHFALMCPEMYDSIKPDDFDIDIINSRTHALIYLLSVETSWMKKSPLSNGEMRKMLSLIAQAIIFNNNLRIAKSIDDTNKDKDIIRIKYAAITVLRMADKEGFIKNISTILNNTQIEDAGSDSIIENILVHINTFISKEYHYAHDELDTLYVELEKVDKLFREKHLKYPLLKDAIWSLSLNADNLIVKGQLRKLRKRQIVSNCLAIIEQGIDGYRYNHTKLLKSFIGLRIPSTTIGSINDNELKYFHLKYLEDWQYVAGFIKNIFGLHFNEIRSVLSSGWAIEKGSNYLNHYLYTKNIGFDDPFSLLIKRIESTNFDCLHDPLFVDDYNKEYSIIEDLFISHPDYNKKESTVIQILGGLQANLAKICVEVKQKYQDQVLSKGFEKLSHTVFYPKDWAEGLFEQLYKNAAERKIGLSLPEIIFEVEVETLDYIELKVKYKNTKNKKVGSRTGLLKHKENLPKFEGCLNYDPNVPGDFFVRMRLLKYG